MFRFTEQELRQFLEQHAQIWRDESVDSTDLDGDGLDYAYARGAYEAYDFVLRFLDEYKLEEGGR